MKRLLAAALLLFVTTAPAFSQEKKKATLKIINQSNWQIHHVFLSSTADDRWGPDQLGDQVLGKGDSLTLTNLSCDTWDMKVVDEDGDECILENLEFCRDDSYWKITDKDLLECEGQE